MTDKIPSGDFVAQHINDGDISDTQIQPNGVDLTIGKVFRTSGNAEFTKSGYDKPSRIEIQPNQDGQCVLHPGRYPIEYAETVEIPDGYVGRVYPRSRLMRSGLHLTSALWDQGYKGIGEGLLQVPFSVESVKISTGLAIAQIVFLPAGLGKQYNGTHQGEGLEADV
jgi:dUTP pyrophosphatase